MSSHNDSLYDCMLHPCLRPYPYITTSLKTPACPVVVKRVWRSLNSALLVHTVMAVYFLCGRRTLRFFATSVY